MEPAVQGAPVRVAMSPFSRPLLLTVVPRRSSKEQKGMVEYIGVLRIKLISGHDLISCDINGRSDPYVIFKLPGQKVKSKIQYETLNPVWNETFQLCVERLEDPLQVEVFDYDKLSQDDPMGHLSINLKDLRDGKPKYSSYALQGVKKGEVHMELTFVSLT